MPTLSGKSIIVIGTEPWFGPLLSKHHVTLELSKQNKVLYLDPVYNMGDLLRLRPPRHGYAYPYHGQIPPTLSVQKPWWLPKTTESTVMNALAEHMFMAQIRAHVHKPDVIISFSPKYYFTKRLAGARLVYYCVDTHFDRSREVEMLASADLVIAATQKLYDEFRGHAHCLKYLAHGVNVDHFRKSARQQPKRLRDLPRPIAGFVGSVNAHLDIDLLESVAHALPGLSIVLIGPYEQDDYGGGLSVQSLSRLKAHSNIHLLGPKSSDQLGAYIDQFDIGLIPYDLNHVRIHFSYHKVLQYMALGKPVVTTVETQGELPPSVWLGRSAAAFTEAIKKGLDGQNQNMAQRSLAFAEKHSWKQRVDQLETWIADFA